MGQVRCPSDCAMCIAARQGRSCYKGHWGYRRPSHPQGESLEMALRRRDQGIERNGATGAVMTCELAGRLEHLFEFLCAETYEDGSARIPGTLTVFREGSMLKGCLNDRDQSLVAFVSASSFTGLLEALDAGLQADDLDWRVSGQKGKKR